MPPVVLPVRRGNSLCQARVPVRFVHLANLVQLNLLSVNRVRRVNLVYQIRRHVRHVHPVNTVPLALPDAMCVLPVSIHPSRQVVAPSVPPVNTAPLQTLLLAVRAPRGNTVCPVLPHAVCVLQALIALPLALVRVPYVRQVVLVTRQMRLSVRHVLPVNTALRPVAAASCVLLVNIALLLALEVVLYAHRVYIVLVEPVPV